LRESLLGKSRARNAVKFFPYELWVARNQEKNSSDKLRTRTAFQKFINKTPHSTFKKLIVSTPGLIRVLHTMSLSKSVPETKSTRMQVNQVTRGPLHSQERQGPGRSRQATPATIQDFSGEGHHSQLSGVAGEWDP
jgi:hypothetical protein